jgi:protein O-mannosyl-transferase
MYSSMDDARRRRNTWLICLGLALAVLAGYGQVWRAEFISYDDPDYVTANPHVQGGLNWTGFIWALTTGHAGNWHPLTWISHMVDVQLYGMNPAGHHLTSVALHLANSILLFLLLQRMTKTMWPGAMVAALFALHPMHVESVAWISERKDVLSTLFWILSIWAYLRHVEESRAGNPKRKTFLILSVLLFALGLMAKPMVVTLPFVLLLLDYWPLQRRQTPIARLFIEKAPYFILAAASCVITFSVQHQGGAVVPLAGLPLGSRLANMPVAYVRYVAKTFWPAHLAVIYPTLNWTVLDVAGATVLLLVLSTLALWRVRAQPWLAVGWLWFLVTLAPVIGVVQVGTTSMADRYSYIPSIGLFIAVVWAVREWGACMGARALVILGALAAAICLVLTGRQAAFWKNTETLFLHAIQNTTDNVLAYNNLASCAEAKGQTNAAISYLETALRIKPGYVPAREKLGRWFMRQGRIDEALDQFQQAVDSDPKWPESRYNLGYALLAEGRTGEALDQFQAQVNLQPGEFKAQCNMGNVLLQNGLVGDAIAFLQKAIEIKPDDAGAHYSLGNAFYRKGRVAEAISQYEKAVDFSPNHVQARNNLAWILACHPDPSIRNGARAVALALRADQLSGGQNPVIIGTLAAGYAEAGKFSDAVAAGRRACQTALAQTNYALAELLEKRLRLYQAGLPWRDTNSQPAANGK